MKVNYIQKYCCDLLSWKEFGSILNITPLMTKSRVNILSMVNYRWHTDAWTLDKETIPSTILKECVENYVCYFRDMSRCSEKINKLCQKLEHEYESAFDAHVYSCKNVSIKHPFGIHYDLNHNVIVQCEGTTNFKIWNEVVDKSTLKHDNLDIKDDTILDINLNPGDAVFIPAFYPHLASSITPRLSVSFPCRYDQTNTKLKDRNWIEL